MNKLTAAWMVLLPAVALGAGFKLDVHSARAIGMGGAVTAFIDDPSAIYYNPAGLTGRKGLQAQLGGTLIVPMINFSSNETGEVTSGPMSVSSPPHLHLAFGITEDLAIGVGVFSPFGSSGHWPADWEGRFKAIRSQLRIFNVNPTLAYRLHPRLRLGAGFNAVRGTVEIERALDFVDTEGGVILGGGAWGFGWNVGVQVDVIEKRLLFGATYRGPVTMGFEGNAHFSNVPVELGARIKDQPITAQVVLPMMANFGLTLLPTQRLKLSLDADYVEWSSFQELAIRFENPDLTVPLQKKWLDQVSVHVGGEYHVTRSVAARLGVVYDPAPSPLNTLTPDLPDSTRIKVTAGVGWVHENGVGLDLGYQFVALTGAASTAPGFQGTYGGTAQVLGLTLSYKMPVLSRSEGPATEPAPSPVETVPAS